MTDAHTSGFSHPVPEAVRAGRVAALYRQAVPGFLVTLAVAAVCAAVLWPAAERAAIAGWFAAVALITGVRYALVRATARAGSSSSSTPTRRCTG